MNASLYVLCKTLLAANRLEARGLSKLVGQSLTLELKSLRLGDLSDFEHVRNHVEEPCVQKLDVLKGHQGFHLLL